MKNVVLSADGERKVYSVPDVVADNLKEYCLEFANNWVRKSKKHCIRGVACFDEDDFVEYLNTELFPEQKSTLIENLGWVNYDLDLSAPYKDCPRFNF